MRLRGTLQVSNWEFIFTARRAAFKLRNSPSKNIMTTGSTEFHITLDYSENIFNDSTEPPHYSYWVTQLKNTPSGCVLELFRKTLVFQLFSLPQIPVPKKGFCWLLGGFHISLFLFTRIEALRQEDPVYNNTAVIRTNAMKYLPNFFKKGGCYHHNKGVSTRVGQELWESAGPSFMVCLRFQYLVPLRSSQLSNLLNWVK